MRGRLRTSSKLVGGSCITASIRMVTDGFVAPVPPPPVPFAPCTPQAWTSMWCWSAQATVWPAAAASTTAWACSTASQRRMP